MNIFYLHTDPSACAAAQCDKHVVKMVLETAQLLCTAHRIIDGDDIADAKNLYKATHRNHPSAVWVRSSQAAYEWTAAHFCALLSEYAARYSKRHACSKLLLALLTPPSGIADEPFTAPPQCMPDEYKQDNTVLAYRAYYIGDKSYMARWTNAPVPEWFARTSWMHFGN
tara:strand:- start:1004 stop:1510 length:507 start_codon:yes stop_codon:yes gene_type:complete